MSGLGLVQIGTYMNQVIEEHRDMNTGEINATLLAEDAAQHFGIEGEPPEIFFDVAEQKASKGLRSAVRNLINSRDSSWF